MKSLWKHSPIYWKLINTRKQRRIHDCIGIHKIAKPYFQINSREKCANSHAKQGKISIYKKNTLPLTQTTLNNAFLRVFWIYTVCTLVEPTKCFIIISDTCDSLLRSFYTRLVAINRNYWMLLFGAAVRRCVLFVVFGWLRVRVSEWVSGNGEWETNTEFHYTDRRSTSNGLPYAGVSASIGCVVDDCELFSFVASVCVSMGDIRSN